MKRCKFQFGIWKKRRATSDRLRVGLRCRRIDRLFQTPIKADVIKLESRINLENAAQHSSMKQCKFQFEILKIERATSDRLRVGTKWRRNENEKQKGPDFFFQSQKEKKRKENETKKKTKRRHDPQWSACGGSEVALEHAGDKRATKVVPVEILSRHLRWNALNPLKTHSNQVKPSLTQ